MNKTEMAKRFKLNFSRVIPPFQFCRFKDPSSMSENPLPTIYRLSPMNPKAVDIGYPSLPAPPPSTPEYGFIKRRVSPKVASSSSSFPSPVGCGCRSRSFKWCPSSDKSSDSLEYSTWKKEAAASSHMVDKARHQEHKHHGEAFGLLVSGDSNVDLSPVRKNKTRQKENKMKKVRASCVSSVDSGWFGSGGEENEETETLVSTSRSFSFDSSYEFHQPIQDKTEFPNTDIFKGNKKKVSIKVKKLRRHPSKKYRGLGSNKATENAGKGGVLRRNMIPSTLGGKARESVAVVKKSKDPYEDFKESMLEMILDKEMFEAEDLEQLLHCFLSLNSRQYHGVIVEAFTEIWEVLFSEDPRA